MGSIMGFFQLIRAAAIGWWNDRAMSLGASIAFFTLFSLAPMLLLAISVVGLAYGREAAQGAVVGELGGLLGKDAAAALEALIASARDVGSGVIGTAVGVVTFLVVATGAVSEIQDNLNIIWKVQGSSFSLWSVLRTRVLSLALVLGIGFLLLVSLLVDAAISVIATYIEAGFSEGLAVLQLLNSVASFLVATLLFAMIFKILPAVALAWRDVAAGAAVTGLLFTVGKVLIGLYIGQSGIASGYGAAASVITIMLWIYYSSLILLFGAEFTKAFAETRGSHAR